MAEKRQTIDNRQTLERWLKGKPEDWAQELTVRTALRILPLVFTVFEVGDGLLTPDQNKRLTLYAFRAAFISWALKKYPPYDALSVTAQKAGEQVFADTASSAAKAIRTVANALSDVGGDTISLAIKAALTSAFAAQVNTDVHDSARTGFAGNAAETAADYPQSTSSTSNVVWDAVTADTGWLEENSGEGLIEQPLWLIDVRSDRHFAANFPLWIREPLDQFDQSALAERGPWRIWLDWYRAILPNTRSGEPRTAFGKSIDVTIATQPNAFWNRDPDEVMADVKAITEGREPKFKPNETLTSEAYSTKVGSDQTRKYWLAQFKDGDAVSKWMSKAAAGSEVRWRLGRLNAARMQPGDGVFYWRTITHGRDLGGIVGTGMISSNEIVTDDDGTERIRTIVNEFYDDMPIDRETVIEKAGLPIKMWQFSFFELPKKVATAMDILLHENGRQGIDARISPRATAPEMSTHATSDLWTVEDKLGYAEYARAIYHFLNDPRTEPPLTISIQAPWGGGKTSLMRMIQKQVDPKGYERALKTGGPTLTESLKATTRNLLDELKNITRKEPTTVSLDLREGNSASIWFNAWRYQSSDQIWSGLAEAIIRGVTDRLEPIDREKFLLRLHLSRVNLDHIRSKVYDAVFRRFIDYLHRYVLWIWLMLAAMSVTLWNQIVAFLGGYLHSAISVAGAGILATGLAYIKAKRETDTEPAKLNLSDYVEVPDYSEKLGFVHHVTEDLRRVFELLVEERDGEKRPIPLLIFIDDLDRCTPDNVADVFEAINQFIAGEFPNCYIVLGMDSEMVAAALEESHKNVIQRLPSYARRMPIGWRFMDKFVQLPFVIPPLDPDAVANYSDYLAAAEDVDAREVQDRASSEVARAAEELIEKSIAEGKAETEIVDQLAEQYVPVVEGEPQSKAIEEARRLAEYKIDSFKRIRFIDKQARAFHSDSERIQSLLSASKDAFQSNPRELKRLVNVYRFYYNLRLARQSRNQPVPTEGQLQNWLTMSLVWPDVVRWLRRSQSDWESDPAADTASVISYRLKKLEELAVKPHTGTTSSKSSAKESRALTVREWAETVREEFGLPENVPWLGDERFFRFVCDMASGGSEQRLSAGAGKGFW